MSLLGLSVFRDKIITYMVGTDDQRHKYNGYIFFLYLNATEFSGIAECLRVKTWCWANRVLRVLKNKNKNKNKNKLLPILLSWRYYITVVDIIYKRTFSF
jgi:hypothetical protein